MGNIFDKSKIILDGAMGTCLFAAGLENGACPEEWILSSEKNREVVRSVQTGYADSGSDILYAPTFGANRASLAKYGLQENIREYNLSLAEITVEIAHSRGILAAGDMSSTGLFMAPMGDMSFDEIKAIYSEQAKYLLEAGVDLFAVETSLSLDETRAAVLAIKELCDAPIITTFTLEKAGRTMSGNTPEALIITLWSLGVDIAGFNCSQGPREMKESFRAIQGYIPKGIRLAAKPNAGLPHLEDGKTVFDMSADEFALEMKELVSLGASVLGGCCGTNDEYIRLLAEDKTAPKIAYTDASHLATDGRTVFSVSPELSLGKRLECDESLTDGIMESDADILNVRVSSVEQTHNLTDAMIYINRPLMLEGDYDALSEAFKLYSGRAILSQESVLSADEKQKLIKKFNPVIL